MGNALMLGVAHSDGQDVSMSSTRSPSRACRATLLVWLALAACALGPSCYGPRLHNGTGPPTRPNWLDGLREGVGQVPPIPANNGPTPTSQEARTLGARGRPKDLTQSINGAKRPVGTAGISTAAASLSEKNNASVMEALYQGQVSHAPSRQLRQFGYDYFKSDPVPEVDPLEEAAVDGSRGDRPQTEGPFEEAVSGVAIPSDYRARAGDEIVVTVTGAHSFHERATVGRDGALVVPEVGPVDVAGRSLEEIRAALINALEETWEGIDVHVGIGRIRLGRVHVVGNVARPGQHAVPLPADVMTVLTAAGGPLKSGSLRRVAIQRADGSEQIIDLYELLLHGRRPAVDPLADGDVISVPAIGATIGVAGVVQRPAIYETEGELTVQDAINLAGGPTPFTFMSSLQIERTSDGRGRQIVDVPFDEEGLARTLQPGDLLLVAAVDASMRSLVRIEGEVVRPGDYQYKEGMRVSELLKLADGMRVDASTEQAFISRQVGASGEVELLSGAQRKRSSRRLIVIDVSEALLGNQEHDVVLQPLDHVTVQPLSATSVRSTVDIMGAVQRPGTYELTSGLRVSDVVAMAGNLLPSAYVEEAEVVRNVYDDVLKQLSVRRMRIDLQLAIEREPEFDPVLVHGDRIVIRQLNVSSLTVKVKGEVRFPGTYVFPASARITDLIAAAGGVLPQADVRASKFTRASVRDLQQRRFRELAEFIREQAETSYTKLVQVGTPQEGVAGRIALEHTRELIQRMSTYQPDGRVVIPWTAADFPNSEFNLTLEDLDTLEIPRTQQTVSVIGHVFNSGAFVAQAGLTVRDIIDQSGGVTEQGDLTRIYVIRADGTVQLVKGTKGGFWSRGSEPVYSGDIVMVPRQKLERTLSAQLRDVMYMIRSGAETGLLLNNLKQVDLGVNWVTSGGARPELGGGDPLFDR